MYINLLTSNDPYSGRTAPLTSKRYILYIYSTNIVTEYFKHGIYSPFFFSSKCSLFHNSNVLCSCIIHVLYTVYIQFYVQFYMQLHNSNVLCSCIIHVLYTVLYAVCFIILTYFVPVLFTFYIQDVLKLKKNNSGSKRLIDVSELPRAESDSRSYSS